MKTNRLIAAIFTFSLVIFAAANGISNPVVSLTGNDLKGNENKITSTEKSGIVIPVNSADVDNDLSYLRFNVDDFISKSTTDKMELPVSSDFEYLRFDVTDYTLFNFGEIIELPAAEFDYLRFDVNTFIGSANDTIDELPVIE